jgi:hypothetical protein
MPPWWLCYRRSGTVGIVIVEGRSIIEAAERRDAFSAALAL